MSGPRQEAVNALSERECTWVLMWLAIGADAGLEGQGIADGVAALRKWQDRHPALAQYPQHLQRPRAAGGSGG